MQKCTYCGEMIRPNQTGGWYHVETPQHRSDQRCFLYASPGDSTARCALLNFARWLLRGEAGEGREEELVDEYLAESSPDEPNS